MQPPPQKSLGRSSPPIHGSARDLLLLPNPPPVHLTVHLRAVSYLMLNVVSAAAIVFANKAVFTVSPVPAYY